MIETDFTDDQAHAVNAAVRWFRTAAAHRRPFLIHGPAGTGKTSIAKRITDLTAPTSAVFVAATGKAASVLESKGCRASTIHSAIYATRGDSPEVQLLRAERQRVASSENPDREHLERITAQIRRLGGGAAFERKDRGTAFDGKRPALVVVDEGSMVSDKVAKDLAAFGIPTLVLGDPHQLPPVNASAGYTQLADVTLTTIHRYAGPLLEMATRARGGEQLPEWSRSNRAGRCGAAYDVALLGRFDQVIVGRNRTRWDVIRGLREAHGRPPGQPTPGDRIMVIRNDADQGVVNGQQATVDTAKRLGSDSWAIGTTDGDGWVVDARGFLGPDEQQAAKDDRGSDLIAATFAQAITCHAAQGSEWDDVAVIDESTGREWLYTAVTRARRECIVLARKPKGGQG